MSMIWGKNCAEGGEGKDERANGGTIQEILSKIRLENPVRYWPLLTAVQIWNKELTIHD